MKKNRIIILAALAFAFASCTKEIIETIPEQPEAAKTYVTRTYEAGLGVETKTAVDAAGKVTWNVGDVVRYYSAKQGEVGECSVAAAGAKANLQMNVASDASFLIAVYGGTRIGDETNLGTGFVLHGTGISGQQTGKFEDGHVAVAKTYDVTNQTINFHNITSFLKFSLTRTDVAYVTFESNNATAIHSYGRAQIFFDGETPTVTSHDYASHITKVTTGGAGTFYIALLPVHLGKGFTIKCYDSAGIYLGSVRTEKEITLGMGKILNLGPISPVAPSVNPDLSAMGTANCYIVPCKGDYHFRATHKGGSGEQKISGTPARAKVLWETFGTDEVISVGDIVKNARYENEQIHFTATGKEGNAVIALIDRDDNILWSWHIWSCSDYDADRYAQECRNSVGTMMDRNLGATSVIPGDVRAFGLLYQWGRKDPFLGSASLNTNTVCNSTITWPSAVKSDATHGTISYSVQNPTTFISENASNEDWYYTGSTSTDDTRWNSEKGVYDPCPVGYRVPNGGTSGIWAKASNVSGTVLMPTRYQSENYGFDMRNYYASGNVLSWYPLAGRSQVLYTNQLSTWQVGTQAVLWSCSPFSEYASTMTLGSDGTVRTVSMFCRSTGASVRCCKDTNYDESVIAKDLSAPESANSYIVTKAGTYRINTVKGNTSESVGEVSVASVLWESFGTSTAPATGDLISKVYYANGHITFKASDKKGNALIAAKDSDGKILWSWHIWLTDKPVDITYNNEAGTMMDRNLGATTSAVGDAKANGLLYQWGRKDPFLGKAGISGTTSAASTLSWPTGVTSDVANGTIDYATANPTTFIKSNTQNYDWLYTGTSTSDQTRWQAAPATKTVYDPCPAGYRVPKGTISGIWPKAFGSTRSAWQTASNWNDTAKGMDFGSTDKTLGSGVIWYPAAGFRNHNSGGLAEANGNYWSSSSTDTGGYWFGLTSSGYVYTFATTKRAYGYSVRCVRE